MHIMVNKRYMWKFDTCAGHEALISKLLVKKPPGIMSAYRTSSVYEQCASRPLRAFIKRGERKKRNKRQLKCKNLNGGRGRTLSPALGIESSEAGCVPWVRLESVIRCISQTVRSTSQDLVDYEGTLPFGLEFVLFLVRQA